MKDIRQAKTPLYEVLHRFSQQNPISFHVPGHKNGVVFPDSGREGYGKMLSYDFTELAGLDDLHEPQGVIEEAQEIAAAWFGCQHTYFLIGGSTVGNLASILASCGQGDKVIVQRNCHKSVMNGLELSGAEPIFVAPEFDSETGGYTGPSFQTVREALKQFPGTKAILLTYPDYFGRTYSIKEIIDHAHKSNVPVLVDEAHGVHFSVGQPFPVSSLELGADAVVQSAHKMAPAMTMGAYLHVNSSILGKQDLEHYLQIVQSSSPSYPIMASLDLARYFLATTTKYELSLIQQSTEKVRKELDQSCFWNVLPYVEGKDDLLKITMQVRKGYSAKHVSELFESELVYPELSTHNQVLFVLGLAVFEEVDRLTMAVKKVNEQLKNAPNHATMEMEQIPQEPVQTLMLSYTEMRKLDKQFKSWDWVKGYVAAEAVIPYPPGVPLVLKGERITNQHIDNIRYLLTQKVNFQNHNIEQGITVFLQGKT